MAARYQKYRLKWPLTPTQLINIDEMFSEIYTDLATNALSLNPSQITGGGVTSFTIGDLLVANSTTSLTTLHDIATGNALLSGGVGVAPFYGKVSLTTTISGVLPIANGGTNATSFTNTRIPFFDGTRFVDDADLTFVTDTLTATKVVAPTSVSTPSLISTAALTVTPAAGSNLNIALATTGDLVVNTNQFYVDTSTAFVGIGTATPGSLLTVEKDAIGVTSTDGIAIQNLTLATAGVPTQWSPRLRFRANVWDTTLVANRTQEWWIEIQPVTSSSPTSELRFSQSNSGATATPIFRIVRGIVAGPAPSNDLLFQHSDNTTGSSNARFQISVGGTSGGDPQISFGVSGALNWSIGLDNSDNDNLKIGPNIAVGTTTAVTLDSVTLNMGVQTSGAPTAKVHIAAGTATANTAPLKFNSGTVLTTAEAGAIEFNTDDFFATITTGAARKAFILDNGARLTSGKMPIATTNGRLIDLTASSAYTPTNVTTDRSYDANATTLDELADVVGTIIADLQAKGILG